jgi:hypothetical protein
LKSTRSSPSAKQVLASKLSSNPLISQLLCQCKVPHMPCYPFLKTVPRSAVQRCRGLVETRGRHLTCRLCCMRLSEGLTKHCFSIQCETTSMPLATTSASGLYYSSRDARRVATALTRPAIVYTAFLISDNIGPHAKRATAA